jgi:hypothetical protein
VLIARGRVWFVDSGSWASAVAAAETKSVAINAKPANLFTAFITTSKPARCFLLGTASKKNDLYRLKKDDCIEH